MLAREKRPDNADIQTVRVIVDAHREQALLPQGIAFARSTLVFDLLAQLLAAKVDEQLRRLGQLTALEVGGRQAGG